MLATYSGHMDIVKGLVDNGASVELLNSVRYRTHSVALTTCLPVFVYQAGKCALDYANLKGHTAIANHLAKNTKKK